MACVKCDFQWIPPDQIGDYWQTIKPGLAETAEKAPGGWTPGDVFIQLANGQATLHLVIVEKYYRGFMVSKTLESHGVKKLIIWIAHGDGSGDLMQHNMEQIREWCRNIGAAKIQMQSNRNGWARVAPKLGFEVMMTIYETDV
jgi:hypothetical protein